jgi:hypothetical protein
MIYDGFADLVITAGWIIVKPLFYESQCFRVINRCLNFFCFALNFYYTLMRSHRMGWSWRINSVTIASSKSTDRFDKGDLIYSQKRYRYSNL